MSTPRTYHSVPLQVLSMAMLLVTINDAHGQCANNNVLNNSPATPPCPGSITVNCIQGGQYVLVNVVTGNTYTFSTCGASWDTQITLYNNAGGGSLGYNDDACGLQSTVTWTATFTGQLRVLVDRYNCATQASCAPLTIQCTAPVTGGDCIYVLNLMDSWGDGWGSSNVGVSINGGAWQYFTVTGTNNSVSFAMEIGDVISLSYNNSGSFQNENSFTLSMQGAGVLYSSGSPPPAGTVYTASVDCDPPPAPQQDCVGGHTICNTQNFNNTSTNTGMVADLHAGNRGCLLSNEQQGTWYYFSPSENGTVGFTIAPNGSLDYDFAVWGPMSSVTCPPAGPPLRCSYASGFSTFSATGSYNTGVGNGATDASEGAAGNGWVAPINVLAGQIYILYIDNFSSTGQSFDLSWQLSGNASLDCTVLPMELLSFEATASDGTVEIDWSTATENATSHFSIERSPDGIGFRSIGTVGAAGYSMTRQNYHYQDPDPMPGTNYYRLEQFDLDGNSFTGPIASVRIAERLGNIHPNPTDGPLNIDLPQGTEGLVKMNVRDLSGRSLKRSEFVVEQGMHRVRIDISELSAGQYLIEMILPGNADPLVMPVLRN